MSNDKRLGIVLTAQDQTAPAFASAARNLQMVRNEAKDLGDKLEGFSAKFGTIGVALSAAFAGSSLKDVIETGDQLSKLSEKTGITVAQLSALRYAGELAGVPLEALGTGMKKLAVTMTEAAGGAKEQKQIFDALGINLRNLDGSLKGSDQMLGELADKFQGFADGPQKAALAVKIFGKAGTDMIPILNQGSAGLEEMRGEAERLGVVFSGDLAKASEEFNDNLSRIKFSVEGSKRVLAQELLPTMNSLAEMFIETRDGGGSFAEMLGGSVRTALQAAAVLAANVSFVLKGIGREIGAIGAQAVALATLNLDGFHAISDAVKEDGVRARKELDDLEQRILNFGAKDAGAGRGTALDPRALGPVGTIREQTMGWKTQAPTLDRTDGNTESAYDKITKSISERVALMDKEREVHRALTDQEKFEVKVLDDVKAAKFSLTAAQQAGIKAALDEARAKDLELTIQRSSLKAAQEEAAERQKLRIQESDSIRQYQQEQLAAHQQEMKSIRDRIQSVGDENQAADMAIAQNISLAEAIEKVSIARLQEKLSTFNGESEETQRIRDEIAERERLLDVLGRQRIGEAWRDQIKQSKAEAKRLYEDIYQGLSDSLFRGFEAGKGFFHSFWDGVKNTIKTTVLRVGIQGVLGMTPLGALAGQTGAPGLGTALSSVSGLGSLGTLASGAGMIGTGLSTTLSNGMISGFGMNMANIGNAFAGGQYMLALGNALPYIGAAIAAISVLSKAFSGGETRAGGKYTGLNYIEGPSGGEINGEATRAAIAATQTSIEQTLKALGSSATLSVLQTGFESSKNGKGFAYAGGQLSTGAMFGQTHGAGWQNRRGSMTPEEAANAFGEELKQATLQALQAADVPGQLGDYLRQLGDIDKLSGGALDAALAKINKAISERTTLEDRYFELTHTAAEVQARDRQRERDALDESNRALYDQVVALQDQKAAADVVNTSIAQAVVPAQSLADALDKLRNPLRTVEDIARNIINLENEGKGLQVELQRAKGNDSVANAIQRAIDTAGFTDAEVALYDYNQALRAQIQALQDAKAAQEQAVTSAKAGTDAAYRALERAVGAQREAAQAALEVATEQRNAAKALVDSIRSDLARLYGDVTPEAVASQGNAFIDQSLATAKASGYLPDAGQLSEAITAAMNGIDSKVYASDFERRRDQLVLAGKLSQLNEIAKPQLRTAEQQLEAAQKQLDSLDEILKSAQDQIDVMRGVDTRVLSVKDAIDQLREALLAELARTAGPAAGSAEQWVSTPVGSVWKSSGGAVGIANESGLTINTVDGMQFTGDQVRGWVNDQLAAGDPMAVYEAALAKGISANSLDKLMGWVDGTSNDWARNVGVPQFDVGTNLVPQDMLAVVHRHEAIVPAAFNPWAPGAAGVNGDRTQRLIEALTAEVKALREQVGEGNGHVRRAADALEGHGAPILVDLGANSGQVKTT